MKLTRRDFLRAAAGMAGVLGLEASGLLKLQEALAAPGAPPVIWLQGQSCSGCSVSFLNSVHYATADDLLLNSINLEYHPNLMAAAGDFAISADQVIRPSNGELNGLNLEWGKNSEGSNFDLNNDGIVNFVDYALAARRGYILIVEGSIPIGSDGHFCHIGKDLSMIDALGVFSAHASQIVAVGTCASYGGIPAAGPNPTGAMGVTDALNHIGQPKGVINIPGCPIHPDWLVGTLISALTGKAINLDGKGRPLAYYGKKIHDTGNCPYKGGHEVKTLGEKGCLKEMGCKGPKTYADCFSRKWNSGQVGENGVNWCIEAGSPCIGCTEPQFPDGDFSPFYKS
jgi:hydrogenase small subunit